MSEFTNLKDDNERLNEHSKTTVERLGLLIGRFDREGLDARAIYAALATYRAYYYNLGTQRLGAKYMAKLEEQSFKLSEALLKRRSHEPINP